MVPRHILVGGQSICTRMAYRGPPKANNERWSPFHHILTDALPPFGPGITADCKGEWLCKRQWKRFQRVAWNGLRVANGLSLSTPVARASRSDRGLGCCRRNCQCMISVLLVVGPVHTSASQYPRMNLKYRFLGASNTFVIVRNHIAVSLVNISLRKERVNSISREYYTIHATLTLVIDYSNRFV